MIARSIAIFSLIVGSGIAPSHAQVTPAPLVATAPVTAPAPAVPAPAVPTPVVPTPVVPAPAAPAPAPAPISTTPITTTVVVAEPIDAPGTMSLPRVVLPETIAPAPLPITAIGNVTSGQTFEQRTAILMNNFRTVLATAKTSEQISSLSNQIQVELAALAVVQNQRLIEQNARIIDLLERQANNTSLTAGK